MKIVQIAPQSGPFADYPLRLTPGINIILGANGIGKTVLLEYASLLGHVAEMQIQKPTGNGQVRIDVALSHADRVFLDYLAEAAVGDDLVLQHYDKALAGIGLGLSSLRLLWRDALELRDPRSIVRIVFDYFKASDGDLKEILADEKRLRRVSIFEPEAATQAHLMIAQALNVWSRPRSSSDGKWTITPRLLRSVHHGCTSPVPPPIFYINTDMYDFGVGLDIRESPKHLRQKITEVLLERLQLVDCDMDRAASAETLSDAFEVGEERRLLGEAAIRDTTEGGPPDGAWARVFNESAHPFRSGSVKRRALKGTLNTRFHWTFAMGRRSETDAFLSSGENQALFILALLYGLAAEGSCMLFDEPELHLTFDAGSSLVAEICRRAIATKSQAIIVTHLPHLHRQNVFDQRDPWRDGDEGYSPEMRPPLRQPPIRMIYIGLDRTYYDADAVSRSAPSAHTDVMSVIGGLRREHEISIWPDIVLRIASECVRRVRGLFARGS